MHRLFIKLISVRCQKVLINNFNYGVIDKSFWLVY